jgi:hypothetical protein
LSLSQSSYGKTQFNSEIAAGDAETADVEAVKSFAYNPAVLSSHEGLSFSPLFFEYNFNKEGHKTLAKAKTFEKSSQLDKITTVVDLVGKPIHLDFKMGGVFLYDNIGFALFPSFNIDSIQRGLGFPIMELDAVAKLNSYVSYGYKINERLSIGTSLKPTYKIQYHFEKNPLEVINNPKSINPLSVSRRGTAVGVDGALTYTHFLPHEQTLSASAVVEDIGQTAYSNRFSKGYSPPPPDPSIYKLGLTYKKRLGSSHFNSFKLLYAYVYETEDLYTFVFPHRFGASLDVWKYFKFSVGSYKGRPSFGLTLKLGFLELAYVNYYEVSTNISRIDPDRRQGLSLFLSF